MITVLHRVLDLQGHRTYMHEFLRTMTGCRHVVVADRLEGHTPYAEVRPVDSIKCWKGFIAARGIQIVHAWFGHAGLAALDICRETDLPLVTSIHGAHSRRWLAARPDYTQRLQGELFQQGDRLVTVSDDLRRELIELGCAPDKVVTLRRGIDLTRFSFRTPRSNPPGRLRLLAAGRLVPKKGIDDLICSFARLAPRFPQWDLVIIGSGSHEEKLKHLAFQMGLQERIEWRGTRRYDEMPAEIKRCHLFCLPSRTDRRGNQEGIPCSLLEAMASGLPAVASHHGGIPELIQPGINGLLYNEGDVVALEKALVYMLKRPDKWPHLAKRARKTIEREHDIRTQGIRWEKLYWDLIHHL